MEVKIKKLGVCGVLNIHASEGNDQIRMAGKSISGAGEFISSLLQITANWKEKMNNHNVIDGEEYLITFISDGKIREIYGKGAYPINYGKFTSLLMGAVEKCKRL